MESLHISVQRVVDAGMFRGISMGPSLHLSHLFYVDDVVFMGHWSDSNIDNIVQVLECFYRVSGLRINMNKSKLMRISVANVIVDQAAAKIGCAMLEAPFSYLGSKMKTLSIGGRLTLLTLVLGSMPIHHMSLFKVPKVLQRMESFRGYFFNGVDHNAKKPIWVKWSKVLASRGKGGLGLSSFYALNRALLFKIYSLETCKKVTVAVKMSHENVGYSLHRIPRGDIKQVQFLEFLASMEGVALVDMRDSFDQNSLDKCCDIEVNVHAWKVRLDCLHTRFNISRQGMNIDSILCPICDKAVESTNHIFFTCHIAREVFHKITSWWDVNFMKVSSYEEWLEWLLNLCLYTEYKKLLEGVCYIMWWII
ncbi:RNA-directed DNA polymerase, eukaryota, reverse transcriptase zinc-binding domain protein [Tanacetum coccineum]